MNPALSAVPAVGMYRPCSYKLIKTRGEMSLNIYEILRMSHTKNYYLSSFDVLQ